jgi:hypothetical protein
MPTNHLCAFACVFLQVRLIQRDMATIRTNIEEIKAVHANVIVEVSLQKSKGKFTHPT